MHCVTLHCHEPAPALGQGTWFPGDDPGTGADEIAALREDISRGRTLIATAADPAALDVLFAPRAGPGALRIY